MNSDSSAIHRHLDDVFAAQPRTPELQDLKEELRADLSARVGELVAGGTPPEAAVAQAIHELGDLGELLGAVAADAGATRGHTAAFLRHRVRPRPAFVVRTVVLGLVLAGSAAAVALAALGLVPLTAPLLVIAVAVAALGAGVVTADALRQETTIHYPVPRGRAALYGAAAACGLAGLALGALYAAHLDAVGLVVAAVALVLLAVVGLVALGTTQTNRTKSWVRELHRDDEFPNPFEFDPMAAARFGIYTVVIGVLATTGFVVLSMTVGFGWSWLAIVAGVVVFMLTLVGTLFRTRRDHVEGGGR